MANTNRSSSDTSSGRRNRMWVIGGIVGLVIVVGVAALVWYFTRPVPEEVSLEAAVADVSTTAPTTESGSAAVGGSLDGVWAVDTSVGTFSFEDATSSFVGFRINEELATIGATTAVGRTPIVRGTLNLSGSTVTDAVIEADLTAIVTNADRRNRAVQRALDTGSFPTATFTLTQPIDLGSLPGEGDSVSVIAVGDLTIKDITRPIEIPLETQLVGDFTVVVGAVDIAFSDWDVAVPSASVVVSVEDGGILELQLFFRKR